MVLHELYLVQVNEAGEAVRDPGTGLCIRCKAGEPGIYLNNLEGSSWVESEVEVFLSLNSSFS